jgi:hypothetical protein
MTVSVTLVTVMVVAIPMENASAKADTSIMKREYNVLNRVPMKTENHYAVKTHSARLSMVGLNASVWKDSGMSQNVMLYAPVSTLRLSKALRVLDMVPVIMMEQHNR